MPLVRYEFVAAGPDQVKAAFRGITAEAQASARAAQASQAATLRATRAVGQQSSARRPAITEQERLAMRVAASQEKAAKQAATAEIREATRSAKAQERIHAASLRDRERAENAARRNREYGEAATQRAAERAQLRAQRERTQFRAGITSGIGRAAFNAVGGVALAGSAAAIGATVAATRDAMRVQELANRVSINARKSGEGFIDPTVLRKEWEQTARLNPGQTSEGVGGAVQSFISMTGDIDTARRGQGVFATTASATGADVNDVARTAAALSMQFDIKGLEEMKDVLASLTFQGKEGAFELRDAAAYMQEMAASAAAFGMNKGAQSVKTLGGLAQIAMTTSGSGAEASTAVQRMFTQLKMKTGVLGKEGIDVYRDGKTRDIKELLPEIIAKVGGTDIAKKQTGLQGVFDVLGYKAVSPLVTKYNAAFGAATGTDEERTKIAMAAVTAEIDKATNAAGTWADVMRDAAQAQTDTSARITAAWEQVVANAAEDILPQTSGLGDAFEFLAEQSKLVTMGLGEMAGWLGTTLKAAGVTKEKSNEDFYKDAQSAVSTFDAEHMGQALTPAEIEQRTKLVRNVDRAKSMAWQPAEQQGFKSFDDFNAALGTELDMPEADRKDVYNRILKDPEGERANLERFSFLIPDAAEGPMRQLAEQATAAKMTDGAVAAPPMIDTAPANKALGDFVAAVQNAQRGMVADRRADLLGG